MLSAQFLRYMFKLNIHWSVADSLSTFSCKSGKGDVQGSAGCGVAVYFNGHVEDVN